MEGTSLMLKTEYDSRLELLFKCQYVLMCIFLVVSPIPFGAFEVWVGWALILFSIIDVLYVFAFFIATNQLKPSLALAAVVIHAVIFSSQDIEINVFFQSGSTFLALICLLEAQSNIKASERFLKFLSFLNVIICVIFIIYSKMPFAYDLYFENAYVFGEALTLGFDNPNATAMILMYSAIINIIAFNAKTYNRIIAIIFQVMLFYLIYQTNSRTAFFCTVVVTVISCIKIKSIPRVFLYLFMAIPIVYLFVLPYCKSIGFLEDVEILGKTIYSGREDIFIEGLNEFENLFTWIFGDASVGMFANYHNAALSILLSCGILGLIIYGGIWVKNLVPFMKNTNRVSYVAICSLLGLLLHSAAESAFLIGTLPYGIMVVTLFILARYGAEEKE